MAHQRIRYRIGIDVGLYSTGLAAIEIDDSSDDPREALPLRILSAMSVIHDGGVDPDKAKSADSRKAVSGAARRARNLQKHKRDRLRKLDETLRELGYPVDQAKAISEGTDKFSSSELRSYPAWNARAFAVQGYIENDAERLLAVTVAIRHIARHRGWRNPYSNINSLAEAAATPSDFYKEFSLKIANWHEEGGHLQNDPSTAVVAEEDSKTQQANDAEAERPTVAELLQDFLDPQSGIRFRRESPHEDDISAHIGKLHQSDYYYELKKIFEVQNIPQEHQSSLFEKIFFQINPRDKAAAAKLVATDDLPGQEKYPRASRSSLAFQKYRILATLTNLKIKDSDGATRSLTIDELQSTYKYLCEKGTGETTWDDVADFLAIERNCLKGVGGKTQDGDPISAKNLPYSKPTSSYGRKPQKTSNL